MRQYAFRKMTHDDFVARVERIDPRFIRDGGAHPEVQVRSSHPWMYLLMGFGWAYLTISAARNREGIQESLTQGSLPTHLHGYVFCALAALLAASAVFLAAHVLRYALARRNRVTRSNSGGLLAGAIFAATLVHTPPGLFEAGLGLIDESSRGFLAATSEGVRQAMPTQITSVAFVSSKAF